MTNGGVMIGSTVRMRSSFLCRKSVRVAMSAKARPSEVQPVAQSSASASVFQATPQRVLAGDAAQAPDLLGGEAGLERRQREQPVGVLDRRDQDPEHREEREHDDQRRDRDDAAGDEGVALEEAARRRGRARTASRTTRRPAPRRGPSPYWPVLQRRQQPAERLDIPARRADGEALGEEGERSRPRRWRSARSARAVRARPGASSSAPSGEQRAQRREPGAAVRARLQPARARLPWRRSAESSRAANTLSCSAYQGTSRKPAAPTASQKATAARRSVMDILRQSAPRGAGPCGLPWCAAAPAVTWSTR